MAISPTRTTMIKVMLTGANGQLGQALRHYMSLQKSTFTLMPFSHGELDIADEQAVLDAVMQCQPDFIINTAAYNNVELAETETEQAFKVNQLGPKNLAKAAQTMAATLIQISTDYVFDGHQAAAYVEDDTPLPLNQYGKSKLAGEQSVQDNCSKHIIIRTAWVFSEWGNNFVKSMVNLAAHNHSLNIVNDQVGCPTYAGDLAAAIINIMSQLTAKSHQQADNTALYDTYHFCGYPYANRYQYVEAIYANLKQIQPGLATPTLLPVASATFASKAIRPAHSMLACSKITNTFGIAPSDWQAGLAKMFNPLTGTHDN